MIPEVNWNFRLSILFVKNTDNISGYIQCTVVQFVSSCIKYSTHIKVQWNPVSEYHRKKLLFSL